jgi:hypothetical protein
MTGRKVKRVRPDLQVRDTAGWTRGGGAFFRRELLGQVWEMRVESGGMISVAQVALLLGVSSMTVHRWISEGELDTAAAQSAQGELSAPLRMRRVVLLSDVRQLALDRGYFMGVSKL